MATGITKPYSSGFPARDLGELRAYRESRRVRDPTIWRLRRHGVNVGRIAVASGLSVSQVERIARQGAQIYGAEAS